MSLKLFSQAIFKFLMGFVIVAALLFLPAGTFHYRQAWLFLAVLFIPMFLAGLVMMVKNPNLLRRRLYAREKEATQSRIIKISALQFFTAFLTAGVSFHQKFLMLPYGVSVFFALVLLASYGLYAEVLRENAYLSRTIQVQEGQRVVDTGLYAVVRHPMYAATVVLFWSMPLVLGSVMGFLIMLPYPLLLVRRIRNEEEVLTRELPGYEDYCCRVRWHILPHLW